MSEVTLYGTPWCFHTKMAKRRVPALRRQGHHVTVVNCDERRCPGVRAYPTWAVDGKLQPPGQPPRVRRSPRRSARRRSAKR